MSHAVINRVRSRERAVKLDDWLNEVREAAGDVRQALSSLNSADVHRLVAFHVLLRRRTKAEAVDALLAEVYRPLLLLTAEVYWGKVWNGRYYDETKGEGTYVTVMTHAANRKYNRGFRGCPLGSGASLWEAILDFTNRAKYEYEGPGTLGGTVKRVVDVLDHRKDGDCHRVPFLVANHDF